MNTEVVPSVLAADPNLGELVGSFVNGCQEEEVLVVLDELLGLCRRMRAGVSAQAD